ncbi:aminoglycoside adenylyltransferase family protein [Rhizobium multihospitium]|uniref:Aminoglycoside (3'') (9) adenylyltransferase n=1 Tax=Rhizobium multihospitium TaxID=410764 RepID=A0A1C3WS60_9HYPH|nr:aminoglycoside adenylyltransferase family protein [Rhizobium multihospitium]SCB42810.1 streptomycin 3-adenylyltransferase [Rhizobium multihospitium]
MQTATSEIPAEARAALAIAKEVFGEHLRAVYLHGSAVAGGLRPQSDVDVLAIIDRPMTDSMRKRLLAHLLAVSGRHPVRPGAPRCIELMVFLKDHLAAPPFPACSEFVYGEWLRDSFEAGGFPEPLCDPDITLVLAQARQQALTLFGRGPGDLLAEIPAEDIGRALREALPALLANLHGDERNVLLTLARMWRTAATGEFVSKDIAADWVMQRPSEQAIRTAMQLARDAYLGEIQDDWRFRREEARHAATYLHRQILSLL